MNFCSNHMEWNCVRQHRAICATQTQHLAVHAKNVPSGCYRICKWEYQSQAAYVKCTVALNGMTVTVVQRNNYKAKYCQRLFIVKDDSTWSLMHVYCCFNVLPQYRETTTYQFNIILPTKIQYYNVQCMTF